MPVYQLPQEIVFPHPGEAVKDGLLAVGGDLSPERLLTAYANGIFPWYSEESPILWWSPDPRQVLYPEELHVSKSLKQSLRSKKIRVSADEAFEEVVLACAAVPRGDGEGTWIVPEMVKAYKELQRLGFAHSIEVWKDEVLSGGLYGVSLGRAFFGESMFHKARDASKVALYHLCGFCRASGIRLIDAQVHTKHMERLGARMMDREKFLETLEELVMEPTLRGSWTEKFRDFISRSSGDKP